MSSNNAGESYPVPSQVYISQGQHYRWIFKRLKYCAGGSRANWECTVDGDCLGGTCGEACIVAPRECFVPTGIVRIGQPGVPDRVTASIFCVPPTLAPAVNGTAGLPGPGSTLTPGTVVLTGF